jgi:HPt (histidine-containing phosphotransfer) domain-containing protein
MYPRHMRTAEGQVSEPVLAREIFDRLRQATANHPDTLIELCREYISEARNALAQIGEALTRADAGQVRERAHYLKGSSMMVGARELSSCCAKLEQMGRDSDLRDAAPELQRAEAAMKAVETYLSQEVGASVLPGEGSAA